MAGQSTISTNSKGILAASFSAFFLGIAPVFGKQAILLGLSPLAVVAIRTTLAALTLFCVMLVFNRKYLYIYPAGLLGCLIAGWINGVGSLFYYSALGRLDASLGQLLYALYPIFLVFWLSLDNQRPSKLTMFRLSLILPGVFLLTQVGSGHIDFIGMLEMLISAALYALHLPVNQRVLRDMPAPTVTFYTLLAMSAIVVPTFLFSGSWITTEIPVALDLFAGISLFGLPMLGLTLVTLLSRVTLFLGVKHLGGLQTALLGLGELIITIFFAHLWLGEQLSSLQWTGAILLFVSLSLVAFEKKGAVQHVGGGFLSFLQPGWIPGEVWQPQEKS